MTWLTTFYLRAFVVLLQIALVNSDENGPLPGFNQQPVDTIIEYSNQSIFCQVKGEKPFQISWRKNEQILDTSKRTYLSITPEGSLNIFNTQKKRDEGYYRCVVENKFGRVVSRSAFISFPYMNPFPAGITKVRVNEGDQAVLCCHAPDSYPDRNIHWLKKEVHGMFPLQIEANSHYTTSESGNLYFSYTSNQNKGLYVCSVENNVIKRVLKRTFVLSIDKSDKQENIMPQVWLFQDKVVMKNSNFMLECIAYGRPIPVMRFRHSRTRKLLKGSMQVGSRLRYYFGRYQAEGDEEYICELVSDEETTSKIAFVRMEAKPKMKKESEEISISIDSVIHLPCVSEGIPPVRYKWFFNGKNEPDGDVRISGGNLTIMKVMKHHQGFYQCIAFNKHGEAIMTIYLKVVEFPPNFGAHSIPPVERTHAVIGGKIEIFCVPGGAPKPSVKWEKKNSKNYILKHNRRFIVLASGTLTIVNIIKSDQGIYICVASNRLGTKRKGGELIVSGGLAIIEPLTTRDTIKTGMKISLLCTISSSDEMEVIFTWKLGNRIIYNNNRKKIIQIGRKQSRLEIKNALNRDTGNYKCIVHGTKDRSDTRMQYIVVSDSQLDLTRPPDIKTTAEAYKDSTDFIKGVPYPPTEVTATEQDGTTIKISWTLGSDNGSPVKKVHIQARHTYDRNNWKTVKISNKTKGFRRNDAITLSPWAEYKIRVIAENSIGMSKPSKETVSWIKTPSAKPEKYPKNIKGIGTAPNKMKISFDPLLEIDQNAAGIIYIIHYKAVGMSYEMIKEHAPTGQKFASLTFQSTDSYYKLYEFQLQSKNDEGYGPRSPIHTAFTGERTPVVAPWNLTIKIKHQSFIEASWAQVSKTRQAMRGKFMGYKFLYWVKPKLGHSKVEQFETTYSPFLTIELCPFTEYYFQVLVYNSAGDGPLSKEEGPIRTPEGTPSKPANLKLIGASAGQATITWSEPLHKNGRLTQYILTYFFTPNGKLHQQELNINIQQVEVSGLSPNKEYVFKLAAATNAGVGDDAVISFNFSKVPSVLPDPPEIIRKTQTAVVLKWTPVNDSDISGYKVFYWHSDEDAMASWERKDHILATIHKLQPDRTYFFQIAVYNKYGTGPKSEIARARTMAVHDDPTEEIVTVSKKQKRSYFDKVRLNLTLLILTILVAVFVPT